MSSTCCDAGEWFLFDCFLCSGLVCAIICCSELSMLDVPKLTCKHTASWLMPDRIQGTRPPTNNVAGPSVPSGPGRSTCDPITIQIHGRFGHQIADTGAAADTAVTGAALGGDYVPLRADTRWRRS